MATLYKILGQAAPASTALTTLFTASTGETIVSTITVCNQSTSAQTFRVAASTSSTAGAKNYLWYNVPVPVADTFTASVTVTLSSGDTVQVQSGSTGTVLSYSAFGAVVN